MYMLNGVGERTPPCGTPFFFIEVVIICDLYMLCSPLM